MFAAKTVEKGPYRNPRRRRLITCAITIIPFPAEEGPLPASKQNCHLQDGKGENKLWAKVRVGPFSLHVFMLFCIQGDWRKWKNAKNIADFY